MRSPHYQWYSRRLRFEPLESRRLLSITVDTLVDENNGVGVGAGTSLREAIAAAAPGDTIDFSVTGTIEVGSTLAIDKNLSITGPGANLLTIRAFDPTPGTTNGDGVQIFNIGDSVPTNVLENSISGLTLTGADVTVGGGAISTSENLVVSGCVLTNNRAGTTTSFGGGGAIQSIALNGPYLVATSLTVRDCVLSGNLTTAEGGAIRKRYGSVLIEDCTITDNSAHYGGGFSASDGLVAVQINHTTVSNNRGAMSSSGLGGGVFVKSGPLSITNSTITGNTTLTAGGGIWADNLKTVVLTDTVLSNNLATQGRGAGVYSASTLTATSCTISDNTAALEGGGVYTRFATLTDCTINHNSASTGGGINIVGGGTRDTARSIVDRCVISDNTATSGSGGGGGINASILTISKSKIRGNRGAQGAGVWAVGGSADPVIVDRTTIADNVATGSSSAGWGGGISFSFMIMTGSTVSGNSAAQGGGLYGQAGRISNSTISSNTATTRARAVLNPSSGLKISFSTVTANTSPAASPGAVVGGTFLASIIAGNTNGDVANGALSQGYNIVGTTLAPSFSNVGDQVGITDPLLGPLADNGGPTKTHLPLPGSPAIDAGNPTAVVGVSGVPPYDQRGNPYARVWDSDGAGGARIDIGAVEIQTLPHPSAVYGDYNLDGVVDGGDFVLARKTAGASVAPYSNADGSGDGVIGAEDEGVWRAHYGETYATGSGASADIAAARSERLIVDARMFKGVDTATPFAGAQDVSPFESKSIGIGGRSRVFHSAIARVAGLVRNDALVAWAESGRRVRERVDIELGAIGGDSTENRGGDSCDALDVAVGELILWSA